VEEGFARKKDSGLED